MKKIVIWLVFTLVTVMVVTARAEDFVRFEGRTLAYYKKVKEVPNVPPGLADPEQARQLIEGSIPFLKIPSPSVDRRSILGFYIIKVETYPTVSFDKKKGWQIRESSPQESVDWTGLALVFIFFVFCNFFCGLMDGFVPRWLTLAFPFIAITVFITGSYLETMNIISATWNILPALMLIVGSTIAGLLMARLRNSKKSGPLSVQ